MVAKAEQAQLASSTTASPGKVPGYTGLPGVPDELIRADGSVRPVWQRFFDAFSRMSASDIQRRFGTADRHLRASGVTYRAHGDDVDRTWPLSHVPLLLDQSEWAHIAEAVTQRAELLERVISDIYGAGNLIADGMIPAAAIAGSTEFVRPVSGVRPPGGKFLNVYAVDIGRGPDGAWWVLNDRTQAPSGLGYALENRLVLSRAFTELYHSMNVERVAPFFEAMREGLRNSADRDEPRIGLLTPGPFSETYSEHATLARYLGFLLVEGDDLAVSDDRIHVRTVAGLKRIDVLMRRVDSNFLDPLELDATSRLGIPGLLNVIRKNGVVVGNMPGSGVLESRSLLGFLPKLSERLLGEKLKMPHIATWWCGDAAARETVLSRLDDFVIEGAQGQHVPGFEGRGPIVPRSLCADERARLEQGIRARGVDYVGQEMVRLSTTPVWDNGQLVPRPFVLRVFATATPDGWKVMTGGFCRIAEKPDAFAVSMGAGARAADVWVIADQAVPAVTLLPGADTVSIRRIAGWVPSRAADNLFWMGRYLERAESTLRLVRAMRDPAQAMPEANRSLKRLYRLLDIWGATACQPDDEPIRIAADALHNLNSFGSARALLRSAQRTAISLRERLSPDAWQVITDVTDRLDNVTSDDEVLVSAIDGTLQSLASFAGLAQENMNRAAGWRFLEMGRRVERAINTMRYAREFACDDASADDLDILLSLVDCQITYHSRYLMAPLLAPVRDMVLLDPYNPRSVAFQASALSEHISRLPKLRENGLIELPERLAINLHASLNTAEANKLNDRLMSDLEHELLGLADAIGSHYFPHGANALRGEKLAGLA